MFPQDAGRFDYILVHGVYSWVPEAAQQAILSICARHLTPEGLAYISCNAYPGGHVRQILRDLTEFHTKDIADPAKKVSEARQVCEFIVGAMPPNTLERQLFGRLLGAYNESDALIRYDLLAEENEPVYFLDFMAGARARTAVRRRIGFRGARAPAAARRGQALARGLPRSPRARAVSGFHRLQRISTEHPLPLEPAAAGASLAGDARAGAPAQFPCARCARTPHGRERGEVSRCVRARTPLQ